MTTTRLAARRGFGLLAASALLGTGAMGTALPSAEAALPGLGYDPVSTQGSLWHIGAAVGAHDSYRDGLTGKGVGVALIDTGVTEVPGLDTGNVYHGPDLSFDSQDPELAQRDAYGHGTHMASIIAGRDVAGGPLSYLSPASFNGIAPDANLLSVKVGASDGAVDVSQVIAAIDWVVQHRDDNGMNVRVINLSYGTDGKPLPKTDPLIYAVEQAWKAGIVVVVAGGNDGRDTMTLANPAQSPYVVSVGAADTRGTVEADDDVVPDWGTRGDNTRHVDLVAPGVSVLGTRVPQGYADHLNPEARVGERFAKASGTSQAAAVVSGAVALLLQARPELTPDQVKKQLWTTAQPFASTDVKYRGGGLLDVHAAQQKPPSKAKQPRSFFSSGTGSLEASRGSFHVFDGETALEGERDIFGKPWDGPSWARLSARGEAWSGGAWRGTEWSGSSWNGRHWETITWADNTWAGRSWRDDGWTGRSWRDGSWTGAEWTDSRWSGRSWRDATFASYGWADLGWK